MRSVGRAARRGARLASLVISLAAAEADARDGERRATAAALAPCTPEIEAARGSCRPSCDETSVDRLACGSGLTRRWAPEEPALPPCPPRVGETRCQSNGNLGWVDEYAVPVAPPPRTLDWSVPTRVGAGPMSRLRRGRQEGGLAGHAEVATGLLGVWSRDHQAPGFGVAAELGVGWDGGTGGGYRAFVGVGPVVKLGPQTLLQLVSRFVQGPVGDRTARGVRNGLRWVGHKSVNELGAIELAHQALFADGIASHDVRLVLSFNPVVLAHVLTGVP